LLTAFPVADEDWQEMGADKMLVKPMHTRVLLEQLEKLLASHERKLGKSLASKARKPATKKDVKASAKNAAKTPAKKAAAKKLAKR